MKKKILIFHNTIAPYRIKFFNQLSEKFDAKICLYYENLKDQKFNYDDIRRQFDFYPDYLDGHIKVLSREIYTGHVKRIKKYRPDIVMVPEYGEALWCAVLLKIIMGYQYKIVTICDDSLDYAVNCKGMRKKSRQMAVKFLDGIILCNDEAKQWYDQHYDVNTFTFPIIQDECDYRFNIDNIITNAEKIRIEYNLTGKRVFLYVGRIAPEKNLEYLVASFIEYHKKYPENMLLIVGGAIESCRQYLDEIQNIIHSNHAADYIKCVGRKEGDELKSWYAVGQIFVLPSKSEPFGTVVNEALIMGEYVMVSKHAGSCCLVDKENGEIIDIDCKNIDFTKVSEEVPVLGERIQKRDSKMKLHFDERMEECVKWIEWLDK